MSTPKSSVTKRLPRGGGMGRLHGGDRAEGEPEHEQPRGAIHDSAEMTGHGVRVRVRGPHSLHAYVGCCVDG